MIEFAINYSTQAAVLFREGRLKIDRFKVPDWPELIDEARKTLPTAVHFNLDAGRAKISRKDLIRALEIANQTGAPYVNLHLGCRASDFPKRPRDSYGPTFQELVFKRLLADVRLALEVVPAERLILENIPYRPSGNVLRPSVEPDLISSLVRETRCGFLFDIPHARISAQGIGMDEREYILRLPLEQVKEMHFTGVHNLGGWLQDHLPALEEDWRTLEWVFDSIRQGRIAMPWMLALEYGGVGGKFSWKSSAQEIESQGRRLTRLIQSAAE